MRAQKRGGTSVTLHSWNQSPPYRLSGKELDNNRSGRRSSQWRNLTWKNKLETYGTAVTKDVQPMYCGGEQELPWQLSLFFLWCTQPLCKTMKKKMVEANEGQRNSLPRTRSTINFDLISWKYWLKGTTSARIGKACYHRHLFRLRPLFRPIP